MADRGCMSIFCLPFGVLTRAVRCTVMWCRCCLSKYSTDALLSLQKAKLEAKLHQTTSAAVAAVGPLHNSVPSNPSTAPGFFIHPSDVIPPTPKTTPLFMTPPLTPPNEAVSAAISVELAQLFPCSIAEPPPVSLASHNKATQKAKPVGASLFIPQNPTFLVLANLGDAVLSLPPLCVPSLPLKASGVCDSLPQSSAGSGLALAISQASHFLQPPPQQSIIIERMHSGESLA